MQIRRRALVALGNSALIPGNRRHALAASPSPALVVPAGIAAYAKGGSIDWGDFHCFALAGQMILDGTPATFCFTINWTGAAVGVAPMFDAYRQTVAAVLEAARKAFT